MNIIQELVGLATAIKKSYFYISECEIAGKYDEIEDMKVIIKKLIVKEDELFDKLCSDPTTIIKFNDYLFDNNNFYVDVDFQLFDRKIFQTKHLEIQRLYNKLYSRVIKLNNESVTLFSDMGLFVDLNISPDSLVDKTIFCLMLNNCRVSSYLRIKHSYLQDYFEDKCEYLDENDHNSLIYYKNLSYYVEPSIETYYLNNVKMTKDIPLIITNPNNYSTDYKKLYDFLITNKFIDDISYEVNVLLNQDFDSLGLSCSKDMIKEIYLMNLKVLFSFIGYDSYTSISRSIDRAVIGGFNTLKMRNKIEVVKELRSLLDEVGKEKELLIKK